MTSDSPRLSGEAYAIERLRDNPQIEFETLRKDAEQAGLTIQPIQYGRARRQLGLTGVPPTAKPAASPAHPNLPPQATAPLTPTESAASTDGTDREPVAANDGPNAAPIPAPVPAPVPAPTPVPAPGRPKSTPAFEFLVDSLRAEPTISYGELKARADGLELKIAPIMYGRAKALLGLVPVRPRGQGKNRKQPAAAAPPATLPPAKASTESQFGQQLESVRNIEDLVQIVKQLDSERRRLRTLLEQIANSIDEALDDAPEK